MCHDLTSVKIATLIAAGSKQDQVFGSQEFLHQAGATVTTVSAAAENLPETGKAGKPLGIVAVESGGIWADKPVATDRDLVTAADIQSMERFLEAFALSCTQHKASSGASLHTD